MDPTPRQIAAAVALLIAMVIAARLGRRQIAGSVILLLLSFAWFTVDSLWEVAVLITIESDSTRNTGITVADLAGFAGIVVSFAQLVRVAYRWRR